MARHSLSHRPRCPFHPTREATDRCDRCYTLVSTEALEEHDLRRLCPPCIDALDLAEQVREDARLTPRNLWRRFRDIDYRVAAIGFAVVAVILGAGAFMVWITARAEPDPLLKLETLKLVQAYYRISDKRVRKQLFETIKAMARSS